MKGKMGTVGRGFRWGFLGGEGTMIREECLVREDKGAATGGMGGVVGGNGGGVAMTTITGKGGTGVTGGGRLM